MQERDCITPLAFHFACVSISSETFPLIFPHYLYFPQSDTSENAQSTTQLVG